VRERQLLGAIVLAELLLALTRVSEATPSAQLRGSSRLQLVTCPAVNRNAFWFDEQRVTEPTRLSSSQYKRLATRKYSLSSRHFQPRGA
jgi:hypothetical protein